MLVRVNYHTRENKQACQESVECDKTKARALQKDFKCNAVFQVNLKKIILNDANKQTQLLSCFQLIKFMQLYSFLFHCLFPFCFCLLPNIISDITQLSALQKSQSLFYAKLFFIEMQQQMLGMSLGDVDSNCFIITFLQFFYLHSVHIILFFFGKFLPDCFFEMLLSVVFSYVQYWQGM